MNDFLKNLREEIAKLSVKQKIMFSVITCEKLLPNYIAFQQENNWGDYHVLEESIDTTYQYLINPSLFRKDDFLELLDKVNAITPHTEEFSGILTSFALDCCTSVESVLNFILDGNTDHVLNISSFAYDTVDMYIQEKENLDPNDKSFEEKILSDDFMRREKLRQRKLIDLIQQHKSDAVTDELIQSFKTNEKIIDLKLLNKN